MSAGSDSVAGVHTPGPWRAHLPMFTPDPKHWIISGPTIGSGTVAKTSIRREADARLIAAAPELLEALEQSIAALDAFRGNGEFPDFDEWEAKARAALAKARSPQ